MGQRVTCMGALHPHKCPQTPPPQILSLLSAINDALSIGYPPQWLEAWNVFLRSVLSLGPHPAPDLLAYQPQICKFSRKLKESSWLMSDTAFRYMAASNVSMAWGKVNEQLYNDILRPSPTAAASYGHRTLASSAFWSLHSFLRHYLLQYLWLPFHCPQPSITPIAPPTSSHLS